MDGAGLGGAGCGMVWVWVWCGCGFGVGRACKALSTINLERSASCCATCLASTAAVYSLPAQKRETLSDGSRIQKRGTRVWKEKIRRSGRRRAVGRKKWQPCSHCIQCLCVVKWWPCVVWCCVWYVMHMCDTCMVNEYRVYGMYAMCVLHVWCSGWAGLCDRKTSE